MIQFCLFQGVLLLISATFGLFGNIASIVTFSKQVSLSHSNVSIELKFVIYS